MRTPPTPDAAAIALFNRQHGYARVAELEKLGLSNSQIAHRVSKGLYTRVARGIVALGSPPPTLPARAMRGVLLAGPGAAASVWTAAQLHQLDAPRDDGIHVVVGRPRRQRNDLKLTIHRSRLLPPEHVTQVHGVPVTTVPRTIADCAGMLDTWAALSMLDSWSPSARQWRAIHRVCAQLSNGRAGVRALAAVTGPDGDKRFRSTLERRAREALRAHGVPDGQWNVRIGDDEGTIREVDVYYANAKLVIEIDGLAVHMRRDIARRDRSTDRRLQLAGRRVLRFPWEDIVFRPDAFATQVKRALDAA